MSVLPIGYKFSEPHPEYKQGGFAELTLGTGQKKVVTGVFIDKPFSFETVKKNKAKKLSGFSGKILNASQPVFFFHPTNAPKLNEVHPGILIDKDPEGDLLPIENLVSSIATFQSEIHYVNSIKNSITENANGLFKDVLGIIFQYLFSVEKTSEQEPYHRPNLTAFINCSHCQRYFLRPYICSSKSV